MLAHRAPRETPVHFTSLGFCNFADPQETAALAVAARSVNAGLVVIDNPVLSLHLHREEWSLFNKASQPEAGERFGGQAVIIEESPSSLVGGLGGYSATQRGVGAGPH